MHSRNAHVCKCMLTLSHFRVHVFQVVPQLLLHHCTQIIIIIVIVTAMVAHRQRPHHQLAVTSHDASGEHSNGHIAFDGITCARAVYANAMLDLIRFICCTMCPCVPNVFIKPRGVSGGESNRTTACGIIRWRERAQVFSSDYLTNKYSLAMGATNKHHRQTTDDSNRKKCVIKLNRICKHDATHKES